MRTRTADRLVAVAAAQHGVVTSAQLREVGLDLRLPRREGWPELAPGTWCTNDDVTDVQLLQAVARRAGDPSLPSGALACRRHRLRDAPPGADALVPHGRRLIPGGQVRLHQTRHMPRPVEVDGWSLAPVDRAVADACRWSPSLQSARALLLAAVADGRTSVAALDAQLVAGPRRGSATLARSLVDARRGAASAPEAEAADAVLAVGGMPALLLNPLLLLDGELLGSPDGWLPDVGLGYEVDSVRHHGDSASPDRTLHRHRRFSDAGLDLLHVVPARLRSDPRSWALTLAERARARSPWVPPRGLVVVPQGPRLGSGSLLAA